MATSLRLGNRLWPTAGYTVGLGSQPPPRAAHNLATHGPPTRASTQETPTHGERRLRRFGKDLVHLEKVGSPLSALALPAPPCAARQPVRWEETPTAPLRRQHRHLLGELRRPWPEPRRA
jgi:hypothetical protein